MRVQISAPEFWEDDRGDVLIDGVDPAILRDRGSAVRT
jgi:hypothetical protein